MVKAIVLVTSIGYVRVREQAPAKLATKSLWDGWSSLASGKRRSFSFPCNPKRKAVSGPFFSTLTPLPRHSETTPPSAISALKPLKIYVEMPAPGGSLKVNYSICTPLKFFGTQENCKDVDFGISEVLYIKTFKFGNPMKSLV